jgi:hypothetical protein
VLLKAAWCGDVRLRVAQFLANLWQGSLHGRLWHEHRRHRPGSPRPQATGTSGALLSSDDFGSSVEPAEKLHPLCQGARRDRHKLEQARSGFDQGVVSELRAVYSGCVALELVGGGVANDYFLVHASSPVSEALIRPAGRLAPSRGSCRSGVGAA